MLYKTDVTNRIMLFNYIYGGVCVYIYIYILHIFSTQIIHTHSRTWTGYIYIYIYIYICLNATRSLTILETTESSLFSSFFLLSIHFSLSLLLFLNTTSFRRVALLHIHITIIIIVIIIIYYYIMFSSIFTFLSFTGTLRLK